jgi:hypothetical protein
MISETDEVSSPSCEITSSFTLDVAVAVSAKKELLNEF